MIYRVVFDVAQQGYTAGGFVIIGAIFIVLGGLMVFRPTLMQTLLPGGVQGRARRIFSRFFLGFASIWTVTAVGTTYAGYHGAATALAEGRFTVIEGPVRDFVPMPYTGHAMESFTVGGRRFSYSDYVVTAGFHQTASHGGPIRDGLPVRVTHTANTILRLEVAE